VKRGEDGVQLVNCQHFTYTCVVVQDLRFRIPCRVVITHALVGPSGKRCVAENHPGLFGAGKKALPENVKRSRYRLNFGARFSVGIFPRDQQRGQPCDGSSEKYGEDDDGDHPLARRLLKRSAFVPGFSQHATMISNRRRGSRMKGQDIGPFWQFDPDGIGGPFRGIVLRQLRSKAPRLYANHGVQLGIKIGLAAKDFGRDLILFQGNARMVQYVFGKIPEQFAEGFRAMQGLTADESFDLPKILRALGHKEFCYIDVTIGYQGLDVRARVRVIACNSIKRAETSAWCRLIDMKHHEYESWWPRMCRFPVRGDCHSGWMGCPGARADRTRLANWPAGSEVQQKLSIRRGRGAL